MDLTCNTEDPTLRQEVPPLLAADLVSALDSLQCRRDRLDNLLLGSCSFTADGWEKTFYPPGLKKTAYLGYYAQQFKSVEVDSTFYRIPAEKSIRGWFAQTPEDFVFACKVPQSITHESCLVDCDGQFHAFVNVMSVLEHKLGPMLFQFPYFNKKVFARPDEFLERLRAFLPKLPRDMRFELEIRNKAWVGPELLDLLRQHGVAFALIDHPWMSRPSELLRDGNPVTADFVYIRLLGDLWLAIIPYIRRINDLEAHLPGSLFAMIP